MNTEEIKTEEQGIAFNRPVMCRATFKGRIPKGQLYAILEHIDGMKGRGFEFEKHERTDEDDWVSIDYVLVKHGT